jgi:hypothetical protein
VTGARYVAAIAFCSLLLAGCGGGDSALTIGSVEKVATTDAQSAPIQARLAQPLAVIAKASDGSVIPRIKIQWSTDVGAGSLSDSVSWTDSDGRAQIDLTLGRAVGSYNVRARAAQAQDKSVSFTATAVAAPALTSVNPPSFTGGDVVTIQGTGLGTGALVEIAGAPATVTAADASSVTAIVPICLPAGQASIRVRINGANSNTINGTYVLSAAAVNLAVGEYASIDPAQLAGCATFPAAGLTGAEYLIAPQSVGAPGVNADYQLSGNAVPITAPPAGQPQAGEPVTAARAFHDWLRVRERDFSLAPRPPAVTPSAPSGTAMTAPPKVGESKEFKVLNNTSGSYELKDFTKVQATAKYVGSHIAIFQDNAAPANGFTDTEFQVLGAQFNDILYDLDNRAFGSESDVDDNGIVYMLLSPVVNHLTTTNCNLGIITGFFFSIDIDPGYSADARANQAEVFYGIVPDPSGSVGCIVPKSRINQIVPSTFIHEFQHMISYGQHVLFRRAITEDTWLNEAMSHLAEELGALKMKEMGDDQAFSDFVIGDLYDAFVYLKSPGTNYVLYSQGGGTLAERGSSWLFLRWLVDQFGPNITRRLEETPLIGVDNVNAATGEPISRLLSQWFFANWVSDLPGFSAPSRLKYTTWQFRTTYASLNQQSPSRFDRPYPLVPQVFNTGTFNAVGTCQGTSTCLKAGSGDYYRVVQLPSAQGFNVQLTNSTGGPIATSAVSRLNVIRIK